MLTRTVTFGTLLDLNLTEYGPRVELEALEFVGNAPIEWRIVTHPWRPGLHSGHPSLCGFHDLQFPIAGGTRGTTPTAIETIGIGDDILHVWLPDGGLPDVLYQ